MSLFKLTKQKNQSPRENSEPDRNKEARNSQLGGIIQGRELIIRPLISEKAHQLLANNTYAFLVSEKANKKSLALQIKRYYGVIPKRVSIIKLSGKKVYNRGKVGKSSDITKAYVTLKDGDKIDLSQ
jgi:large subunit ribosomal protein L23